MNSMINDEVTRFHINYLPFGLQETNTILNYILGGYES
jgi:hypothetical protein